MALWDILTAQHIATGQNAVSEHFPHQQVRWIRGLVYTLLGFAMVCCGVLNIFKLPLVIFPRIYSTCTQ